LPRSPPPFGPIKLTAVPRLPLILVALHDFAITNRLSTSHREAGPPVACLGGSQFVECKAVLQLLDRIFPGVGAVGRFSDKAPSVIQGARSLKSGVFPRFFGSLTTRL
jgi:hypothetical protein